MPIGRGQGHLQVRSQLAERRANPIHLNGGNHQIHDQLPPNGPLGVIGGVTAHVVHSFDKKAVAHSRAIWWLSLASFSLALQCSKRQSVLPLSHRFTQVKNSGTIPGLSRPWSTIPTQEVYTSNCLSNWFLLITP